MRDRFGKSARLKEIRTTQTKRDEMMRTFWDADAKIEDTPSEEIKSDNKEMKAEKEVKKQAAQEDVQATEDNTQNVVEPK